MQPETRNITGEVGGPVVDMPSQIRASRQTTLEAESEGFAVLGVAGEAAPTARKSDWENPAGSSKYTLDSSLYFTLYVPVVYSIVLLCVLYPVVECSRTQATLGLIRRGPPLTPRNHKSSRFNNRSDSYPNPLVTMPLNYSKWDALEVSAVVQAHGCWIETWTASPQVSDDSDIEGHPNVDHKSLVRWKQRDIHEKREARKRRIAELKSIIALNDVLIPRAEAVLKDVQDGGPDKYSQIVERLRTQPSDEKPQGGQQTYDNMICQMLLKIRDELKESGVDKPDTDQLVKRIQEHIDKMHSIDQESKEALDDEEREQKKKITSDDIHEGFSATVSPTAGPIKIQVT